MMCPRVLRKWDDKECLIDKKEIPSFFLFIDFLYIVYDNEPHGHRSTALKSPGGVAISWLAL